MPLQPVVTGPSAWARSKDKRKAWYENGEELKGNNMRIFKTQ